MWQVKNAKNAFEVPSPILFVNGQRGLDFILSTCSSGISVDWIYSYTEFKCIVTLNMAIDYFQLLVRTP